MSGKRRERIILLLCIAWLNLVFWSYILFMFKDYFSLLISVIYSASLILASIELERRRENPDLGET